ncbi:MAG: hypothetical protein ACJA13_003608, partial [Paraglaciecola sp.]
MSVRNWLFGGVLALSLGLNLYLLLQPANNPLVQPTGELPNLPLASQSDTRSTTARTPLASNASEPVTEPSATHYLPDGRAPSAQLRATWLKQNRKRLQDGQYQRVALFLQDYLKQFPQDLDFLILEGDLVAKTSLLSDAILHYYTLLALPLNKTQRQ